MDEVQMGDPRDIRLREQERKKALTAAATDFRLKEAALEAVSAHCFLSPPSRLQLINRLSLAHKAAPRPDFPRGEDGRTVASYLHCMLRKPSPAPFFIHSAFWLHGESGGSFLLCPGPKTHRQTHIQAHAYTDTQTYGHTCTHTASRV